MTQPRPILHVISLGAGVQSTTMALMAAHGEIEPMPDAAIFADTGAEPKAVYEHLDWLRSPGVLPFPVEVVRFSDLAEDIRKTAAGVKPVAGRANGYLAPPFFTVNADGSHGMLRRECTSNYKIKPIQRPGRTRKLRAGCLMPCSGVVDTNLGAKSDARVIAPGVQRNQVSIDLVGNLLGLA